MRGCGYAVGVVARVDDKAGIAEVEVGENRGVLPISGMRWARKPNPEVYYPDSLISRVSTALKAGDVVLLRRVTFDDWRIDACPHHGPSLAADTAGQLHAVWFNQGPQRSGVFYGRLLDDGVAGQRRIGNDTAAHADIAITGKRIAIAWKEFDGERSRLKAMISRDGGANWNEEQISVTGGASDQP